ncbi:MAG: phosphoglucosamine mutase [Gammaproteobacteria bacterium]|nr:phosphoglucosamine mutase [Gammaproteobacteria bacterium]
MTKKYFGTDGIRGKVGTGLMTPEKVLKLGWAVGRVLTSHESSNGRVNKVVIGKDTRISGYMFESALEAGLSAAGVDIELLGPMPTPGIAYLTRTLRASAGIVISASHNPYYDNGLKFFSPQGEKLDDELEYEIEAMYESEMDIVESSTLGKARRVIDADGRYIEACKATIPMSIRFNGLKLVLDCSNGATYDIAPKVFEELGAKVIAIGDKPDGLNINFECGSTDPEHLVTRVKVEGADLGIAFDGDGDRVLMVDNKGEVVDGDELLYVIARSRLSDGEKIGGVVGTLMSNLGMEIAVKELGVGFERSKVGDRYVLETMNKNGWTIGGESSGHIICSDRTTTGDGIVSALQVLAYLVKEKMSLHEAKSGMNKFPQLMINVPLQGGANQNMADPMQSAAVQQAVARAEAKLNGRGRVLLRPSGTEPLIRVMVEGEDELLVSQLANDIAAQVTQAAKAA